MTNKFTETATLSSTAKQEINLDILEKAFKMIKEAPPLVVKIKVTKNDSDFFKSIRVEEKPLTKFGGLVSGLEIPVEVNELVDDGKAEILYSDGTTRIINLKSDSNDK